MGARQAAVDKVSKGLRKGFQFLAARARPYSVPLDWRNVCGWDLSCICDTSCGMTLRGYSRSADCGYATSATVTGPSGTSNE